MNKEKPETVEQLVKLVQQKFSMTQKEVIEHVLYLQKQGKLSFHEHTAQLPSTIRDFLFSTRTVWFWIITILALAGIAAAFTIDEKAFPFVYARHILGSLFALYLPGYSLIKALFPQKELDNILRNVLSILTSLAIVPITSFILNYTPWGITLGSVTLSLFAITITIAIVAIIREHEAQSNK